MIFCRVPGFEAVFQSLKAFRTYDVVDFPGVDMRLRRVCSK